MAAASVGLNPFDVSSLSIAGSTAALTMSHYIWTTVFDYVNACQDTPDDEKAGVRSMAVRYQDTTAFIATLGAAQVGCLVLAGVLAGFSPVYFVGAVGGNIIGLVSLSFRCKGVDPCLTHRTEIRVGALLLTQIQIRLRWLQLSKGHGRIFVHGGFLGAAWWSAARQWLPCLRSTFGIRRTRWMRRGLIVYLHK